MIYLGDKCYCLDRQDGSYVIFNADTMQIFIHRGNIVDFKLKRDDECPKNIDKLQKKDSTLENTLVSLTICISERCNLACKYCYANGGNYGRDSDMDMTFEDMKLMFEDLLKLYPRGIINYTFFGGEPMLAFRDIVKFVNYVLEESGKRNLYTPHFAIITNGTLITEEAWEFFNKYNVSVTVSLDGSKEINDEMRVYLNSNKSVYDTVEKNITKQGERNFLLVAEATLGMFFFRKYVPGSVSKYIETFNKLGFDSVSPFVAESGDLDYTETQFVIGVENFYQDLVDYYMELMLNQNQYEKVPSYILSVIVNILLKKSKKTCSAGKESLFYTKSGDVYPCQMYYGDTSNKIANISELELLQNRVNSKKKILRSEISQCNECFANRFCTMWCPGGAYMFAGCEHGVDPVRCIVQKAIGERMIYWISKIFESDKRGIFVQNVRSLSVKYSVHSFLGGRFE